MTRRGRVAVLGGVNEDIVVGVPHLPSPGETVIGGDLARFGGGKGANQAVAAARAGAEVRIIGAVGDDEAGERLAAELSAEGVDVSSLQRIPGPTGTALIAIDPTGENLISVAPGANARVAEDASARAISDCDLLLASLEVPLAAVVAAAIAAGKDGASIVLNAAPAQPLPAQILAVDPILVVNEREALMIGAASRMGDALDTIAASGVSRAIVTRGSAPTLVRAAGATREVPVPSAARVTDTTGAGDTFCGVLAAWLAGGASLLDAVAAASTAASLSVSERGARLGMPSRERIDAALGGERPGPDP